MRISSSIIGKAKAVFVFKDSSSPRAVVSSIVVRERRARSKQRLTFTGQAVFDTSTKRHIRRNILPLADRIVRALRPRCKPKIFDISVVNVNAASVFDLGLDISGFSADLPILQAILSRALGIPIPQDILTTGHIASADGDIRSVFGLKAKALAAMVETGISRFVYPDPKTDQSLPGSSHPVSSDGVDILPYVKSQIRITAVGNIADLLEFTFRRQDIVQAALKHNFFFPKNNDLTYDDSHIGHIVRYITCDNDKHFWCILQNYLLTSDTPSVQRLLQCRLNYHISRRRYPSGFGGKLLLCMLSMPPALRRINRMFPLVPPEKVDKLCRYAGQKDHPDVHDLHKAIVGGLGDEQHIIHGLDNRCASSEAANTDTVVEAVIHQISAETIAKKITGPLDQARAGYILQKVTVDYPDEFHGLVASFYLYLISNVCRESATINTDILHSEAFNLLEGAFANQGGCKTALAWAQNGINGGMRYVCDIMTDQLKQQLIYQHVDHVLKLATDPQNWSERETFMESFLEYIRPHLPREFQNVSPANLAHDENHEIVKAYVSSITSFRTVLRKY